MRDDGAGRAHRRRRRREGARGGMTPVLLLVDLQNDFLDAPGLEPAAVRGGAPGRPSAVRGPGPGVTVVHAVTSVDPGGVDRMPHWKARGPGSACAARRPRGAGRDRAVRAGGSRLEDFFLGILRARARRRPVARPARTRCWWRACTFTAVCARRSSTRTSAATRSGSPRMPSRATTRFMPRSRGGTSRDAPRASLRWRNCSRGWAGMSRDAPGHRRFPRATPTAGPRSRASGAPREAAAAGLAAREAGAGATGNSSRRRAARLLRTGGQARGGTSDLGASARRGRRKADLSRGGGGAARRGAHPQRREAALRGRTRRLGLARTAPGTARRRRRRHSLEQSGRDPVGQDRPALVLGNTVVWKPSPAGTGLARRDLSSWPGTPAFPKARPASSAGDHAHGARVDERSARRRRVADGLLRGGLGRAGDLRAPAHPAAGGARRQQRGDRLGGRRPRERGRARRARRLRVCGAALHREPARGRAGCALRPFPGEAGRRGGRARWGDPLDPATEVGPLVSAEARDRVAAAVERAAAGAERVVVPHAAAPRGGRRRRVLSAHGRRRARAREPRSSRKRPSARSSSWSGRTASTRRCIWPTACVRGWSRRSSRAGALARRVRSRRGSGDPQVERFDGRRRRVRSVRGLEGLGPGSSGARTRQRGVLRPSSGDLRREVEGSVATARRESSDFEPPGFERAEIEGSIPERFERVARAFSRALRCANGAASRRTRSWRTRRTG